MNSRTISLNELNEIERELIRRRDVHAAMINSRRNARMAAEEYNALLQGDEWRKDLYKTMEAGIRLHRGDVMDFANDKEFIESYDKFRLKIYRAVSGYRRLEELREKNPESFNKVLLSMHMTGRSFDGMSDKINVLDMQGRYMDVRSGILANPYYISLREERFDQLKGMEVDELKEEIEKIPGGADAESKKSILEAVMTLKKMEGYGITGKKSSTKHKYATYDTKSAKKNGVYVTFNSLSHDEGIEKKPGKKKSFWEYIKGHKWKAGSSDSHSIYGNKGGERTELMNVKTNIANGKYRVLKLGGKYTSKNKAFSTGVHVSGGMVKGSADVGAVFTGNKLWENKLYASAGVTAYGVRGVAKAKTGYRKDWTGLDVRAEGSAGYASATGTAGVGMIKYVDDKGKTKEGFGVNAGISAKTAVAEGSVGGGITIFGIRFGGRVMGSAASAGFSAKVTATLRRFAFGLSGALGLGAGFEVSIDWSGLKEKLSNWRKRRKQNAKLKDLKAGVKTGKSIEIEHKKEIIL